MPEPHTEYFPAVHMAGVLVQTPPQFEAAVAAAVARMPGAQVHAAHAGKLVVTLESEDATRIVDGITSLQRMNGVVSAVLVSEHSEPAEAANEEIPA